MHQIVQEAVFQTGGQPLFSLRPHLCPRLWFHSLVSRRTAEAPAICLVEVARARVAAEARYLLYRKARLLADCVVRAVPPGV